MGTLFGAVSSLYDKYLLGTLKFSVPTVQCWFQIYLLVFFAPFALGWKLRLWPRNEFSWRWSVPFIALSLLVADYLYFSALRHPDGLVALVMSLRRASTLVAFAGGLWFFHEVNGWRKLPAVIGILLGVVLTHARLKNNRAIQIPTSAAPSTPAESPSWCFTIGVCNSSLKSNSRHLRDAFGVERLEFRHAAAEHDDVRVDECDEVGDRVAEMVEEFPHELHRLRLAGVIIRARFP